MGRALALVPIPVAFTAPTGFTPGLVVLIGRPIGQYRRLLLTLAGTVMCAGRFGARYVHVTIVVGMLG